MHKSFVTILSKSIILCRIIALYYNFLIISIIIPSGYGPPSHIEVECFNPEIFLVQNARPNIFSFRPSVSNDANKWLPMTETRARTLIVLYSDKFLFRNLDSTFNLSRKKLKSK